MPNKLVVQYCPQCGGQIEDIIGMSGNCPNCRQHFTVEFDDEEVQRLSNLADMGIGKLAQIKRLRSRTERDDWELEKEKHRFHSQEATKECACGAINPQSAKFCLDCGQSFGQSAQSHDQPTVIYQSPPIAPPMTVIFDNRKICPNCGNGNVLDAAFCGMCGYRFAS